MATLRFGTVDSNGEILVKGSGNWQSVRIDVGQYTIHLNEPEMNENTVVLCSGHAVEPDDRAADNVFTPFGFQPAHSHFSVVSRDVAGGNEGEPQDAPFSFLAMIP